MFINLLLCKIFSIGTLLFSLLSISASNVVVSVILLIAAFVCASLFLMNLGLTFLSLALIIIYVGAIAVLFLFGIMMMDIGVKETFTTFKEFSQNLPLALAISTLFTLFSIKLIHISPTGYFNAGGVFNINSITKLILPKNTSAFEAVATQTEESLYSEGIESKHSAYAQHLSSLINEPQASLATEFVGGENQGNLSIDGLIQPVGGKYLESLYQNILYFHVPESSVTSTFPMTPSGSFALPSHVANIANASSSPSPLDENGGEVAGKLEFIQPTPSAGAINEVVEKTMTDSHLLTAVGQGDGSLKSESWNISGMFDLPFDLIESLQVNVYSIFNTNNSYHITIPEILHYTSSPNGDFFSLDQVSQADTKIKTFEQMSAVGFSLYTLIPFLYLIIGIILLFSMFSAVMLTQTSSDNEKETGTSVQQSTFEAVEAVEQRFSNKLVLAVLFLYVIKKFLLIILITF